MDSCKSDTILYLLTSMISPAWVSTLLVVLLPSQIPLHINMSPWKPNTAVRDFATTLDEAMFIFDDHKYMLRRSGFQRKLRLLKLKSHTLCQALRVADRTFSWSDYSSWLRYISMTKHVLKNAREGQREAKALKRDIEDIILADEAETLRVEVDITQHPADSGVEVAAVLSASALPYQISPV
ncbi:hypothetical protein IW261DRAFT_1556872 [Armillaria novae-zelandiae]|uniref:Uncharacterized protein n=1 Tax=Armillaria novae-zelandiae TaxID=153914 RepID=A0AA39PQA7_9AGAR|nr:hypothetical protein IW261DRAFT_1556872 [Armillaria novae-zelandiae]